jgi:uncharacterized protein YdeI (YjbR/CyaY-like superfamily)
MIPDSDIVSYPIMPSPPIPALECTTRATWRAWLEQNHATACGVWLITYKKAGGSKHIPYADTVEEALCFGWVDSKPGKVDEQRSKLYFSPRKPKSAWAKPNKIRIEALTKAGLMQPAGLKVVEIAKLNGTWTLLDDIEEYVCPPDLEAALKKNKTAKGHFDKFPPGVRKNIYQWIILAKRPETRQKRIEETVSLAEKNIRANQYRKPGE